MCVYVYINICIYIKWGRKVAADLDFIGIIMKSNGIHIHDYCEYPPVFPTNRSNIICCTRLYSTCARLNIELC